MIKKTLVFMMAGIFVCSAAFAMCGVCDAGDRKESKESASVAAPVKVNNAICPVTGEKVDMNNPVTVEHDGKTYNLCCPMCIADFKKDPAKYIAKIDVQKK